MNKQRDGGSEGIVEASERRGGKLGIRVCNQASCCFSKLTAVGNLSMSGDGIEWNNNPAFFVRITKILRDKCWLQRFSLLIWLQSDIKCGEKSYSIVEEGGRG